MGGAPARFNANHCNSDSQHHHYRHYQSIQHYCITSWTNLAITVRNRQPRNVERCGSVTMTPESCKNDATTTSHMHFSGYVGHVTIFSWMLTTSCCLVMVMIRLSGWLLIGYAHAFLLLFVVVVTLPTDTMSTLPSDHKMNVVYAESKIDGRGK